MDATKKEPIYYAVFKSVCVRKIVFQTNKPDKQLYTFKNGIYFFFVAKKLYLFSKTNLSPTFPLDPQVALSQEKLEQSTLRIQARAKLEGGGVVELPDIRVPTKQDDAFSPFQVSRVFKNVDILIWGRNFGDFNELRGTPRSAGFENVNFQCKTHTWNFRTMIYTPYLLFNLNKKHYRSSKIRTSTACVTTVRPTATRP